LQAGADYLVVGRPVTQAPDPLVALQQLVESCQYLSSVSTSGGG